MRNPYLLLSVASIVFIAGACTNGSGATSLTSDSAMKTAVDSSAHSHAYSVAMVDNKKDPSCGMPVTAGIGDTVHYEGKVIGFCSKECKDDFLKDPVAGLKKTESKK